jgi:hypothetical protein
MTRAKGRLVGFGFLLSVAVFGCAGGGSSDGNGNGDPAATKLSCMEYCIQYIAASCSSPVYTSMTECGMYECNPLAAAPAGCQTALKTYYDCRRDEADICNDVGCDSQFAAVASCH